MTRRRWAPGPPHLSRVLVGVAFLLGIGVLGSATPATADVGLPVESADSCQATGGVYVYIQDFGSTTGGGCSHSGGDSLRVLQSLTSVSFNSSGLICRIGGYPSSCPEKPMPYWSYWLWNGSSWVYSTRNAAGHVPEPGSVEAWNYSNTAEPSVRPPAPSAAPATGATSSASGSPTAPITDNGQQSGPVSSDPASGTDSSQTPWGTVGSVALLVLGGGTVAEVLRRRRARH